MIQSSRGPRPRTFSDLVLVGASSPVVEDPPKEGEQGSPSGGAAEGAGKTSETRDPEARVTALTAEKDRHFARAQEAERERDELRKEKEQRDREKLTAEEKVSADLKAAQTESSELRDTNRRLVLENAFLKDSTHRWQDPSDALALVDRTGLEVDEKTGEVKDPAKLTAAIKDLASKKPYLLATAEPPGEKEKKQNLPPGSGTPPNGQPAKTDGTDEGSLRQRFPALRSH